MARILVADDDVDLAQLLCDLLVDEGHVATAAPDARSLLDLLERHPVHLVIADRPELVREIKTQMPPPAVIATWREGQARAHGAAAVLEKPIRRGDLVGAVCRVLGERPRLYPWRHAC